MATQPPPDGIDLAHSNRGNRGANDEIPSDGLTAQGRDGLSDRASRGHRLDAQQVSADSIGSAHFSPVRLDVWKDVIKPLLCFTIKNKKYCLMTKDGQGIIQKFDAIQEVQEFLLKHGIPMHTERFSKDFELVLFRTISETHVPKPELSNAILKIPSNTEIIPILQSLGFDFATSNGDNLHVFQKPQIGGFNRIYLPKSLDVVGESPPSSYGSCGVHSFETLEDIREYIRGTKQLQFVSDLIGRTRRYKPVNQDDDGNENKKWKENMLLLRIWGATSSRPLPTFDWKQWKGATKKHKEGLNEGFSKDKRSNATETSSSAGVKRIKNGQPATSSTTGNSIDQPTAGQLSIRQLEAQYLRISRKEKTLEIRKLKGELGKDVGVVNDIVAGGRKQRKSFKSLLVEERHALVEKLEQEKQALSLEVNERNASARRWLALEAKTQTLLTGASAATEGSLSFSGISLETMQAREKAAGEEYSKRKTQHEQLLLKIENKKNNIERLKIETGKNKG